MSCLKKNSLLFLSSFFLAITISCYSFGANNTNKKPISPRQDGDPSDIELSRRLGAVGTGPYFGIGSNYDGSDLVVLQPNIHKDLALLKQNQRIATFTGESGGPRSPYVQLSGYVETQATFENKTDNSITLTAANLDIASWINPYLTAYTNFGVITDETQNQDFRMITGFITLGNIKRYPVYLTMGQIFVPFGSFSTATSNIGTLPRNIGRIHEQAISVGYYPGNGLHMAAAIYDGKTQNSNNTNVDQFAATSIYEKSFNLRNISKSTLLPARIPSRIKTGISYTNNIADTAGIRNIFINNASLRRFVPGIDIFAHLSIGPFVIRGEYVSALEKFSKTDVMQGKHSVKPNGLLAEIEYDTAVMGKGTALVFHYSELGKSALVTPVDHQLGFNISVNILRDTIFSLEYSHRENLSRDDHAVSVPTATAFTNLVPTTVAALNGMQNGRNRNVLVATLDLFF